MSGRVICKIQGAYMWLWWIHYLWIHACSSARECGSVLPLNDHTASMRQDSGWGVSGGVFRGSLCECPRELIFCGGEEDLMFNLGTSRVMLRC